MGIIYYCPVGEYWIESVMYFTYVTIVTYNVYLGLHDLTHDQEPEAAEWIMWYCSVAYITSEISQIVLQAQSYVTQIGNLIDS